VEIGALQPSDCETTVGGGPQQVVIEALATPAVPCTLLGAHHRVEFVNNTTEELTINLSGSSSATIAPAETFVTEPIGTLLQPGVNQVDASPFPVGALWYVEPSQNPLAGQAIGLSSIGSVSIGLGPEAVSEAAGNKPVDNFDADCYVSAFVEDPYSPLFTFRDGAVAVIQVFTPGQLTRSEIGIGSAEGDVLAAYGQQIETAPSPDGDPAKKLLVFVPVDEADQVHRLVFLLENDVVVSIRNGLSELAIANPDCAAG
jgi:hypothetical protein